MTPTMQTRQKIYGLSLIELMVALAVSAIMLLGVTTVYTASQRTYQISSEMAGLQENARFALHTLTTEIRMSGYTGCSNIDAIRLNILSKTIPDGYAEEVIVPKPKIPVSTFGKNNYVTGHTHDGSWKPPFDPGLEPVKFEPGTDAITIRSASACSASVIENNSAGSDPHLIVQGNCGFKQGEAVIVTDCKTADLFTIKNEPKGSTPTLQYGLPVNIQKDLTKDYKRQNNSRVLRANAIVYYIGKEVDKDGNVVINPITGKPNLGLYENRLTAAGMVQNLLIPNVDDMLITYGLDLDGERTRTIDFDNSAITVNSLTAADYQTAIDNYDAEATDSPWSRVVRVNMQLLLSTEPVGTTLRKFSFDGVDYEDTRSRRVFNTTINMRNRTP